MIVQSCLSDGQRSNDREALLDGLLASYEEVQDDGQCCSAREFLASDPQLTARADFDELVAELEQRWSRLRSVDEIIAGDAGSPGGRETCIPGYQILKELDRGGMGVIYLAHQAALERPVAIKVLVAGQFSSPATRQRFRREAATVARLRHPHIVQIYDSGEVDGLPFLALEWMEGGSLKSRVAGNPLPSREAATMIESLARAIEYAHQQGVIHRDLKPSNVLLSATGTPKVADFGLAKLLEHDTNLTRTGDALGTPRYMAPEQIRSGEVGPQADVYALGATLYEVLAGRPAFAGESGPQLVAQVMHENPSPVSRHQRGISRDLDVICQKCLEKSPAARYATAGELAADLKLYLIGEPILARRQGSLAYGMKWARRHPAVSSLLVLSILLLLCLYGATLLHSRQLRAALTESQANYQKAVDNEEELKRREQALVEQQYAMRIRRAQEMIENANARTALASLSNYGDGQPHSDLRGFEWYLVRQWCDQSVATVDAHEDRINTIAYSVDDSMVATASDDGTVKLWNSKTYELLNTLAGHASCVNEAAFLPGGNRLVTASCDHTVRIWDTRSAGEIATLVDIGRPAWWVAVSPDGKIIATPAARNPAGPNENQISLWDSKSKKLLQTSFANASKINSAAFTPDGKQLVTANLDGSLRFWDVRTSRQTHLLPVHFKSAFRVRFDAHGQNFVSVGADGYAIVWKTANLTRHRIFHSGGMVYDASFSADGAVVALACNSGNTELFDIETGRRTTTLFGHSDGVRAVACANTSDQVVSGANAGPAELRYWKANKPTTDCLVEALPETATAVTFDEALEKAVICIQGRTLMQWNIDQRKASKLPAVSVSHRARPAFSHRYNYLAAQNPGGVLTVWHATNAKPVASLGKGLTPIGQVKTDGQPQLATWSLSEDEAPVLQVQFWSVKDWSPVDRPFQVQLPSGDACFGVAVHPSREFIALATRARVRVFARSSAELISETPVPAWKGSLSFSIDGRTLLWGNSRGDLTNWIWQADEEPISSQEDGGMVCSLTQSPDGKTLAVGDNRGNIRLRHAKSGQSMLRLKALDAPVRTLAWSSDGTGLACFCREDGGRGRAEIRKWSIDRALID